MKLSWGRFSVLSLCLTASVWAAEENNWGQWRGPLGTGAAPEADPPVTWNDAQGVKWKVKIPGRGTGSPVIWGDQVFVQTAIPAGKKVTEYPSVIAGPVLAAQEQPRREGQGPAAGPGQGPPGEGRRRGGGPGFGRGEKPTEEHQFVIMSIDRKSGKIQWQETAKQELPHEGHHQDHSFASASSVTDGEQVFAFFGSRGLYAYDMKGKPQ